MSYGDCGLAGVSSGVSYTGGNEDTRRLPEVIRRQEGIAFGHFLGMVAHQLADGIKVNLRITNLLANVGGHTSGAS